MSESKQLRLALVNPPSYCVENDRLEPPLGMLYIAAAAREAGYEDVVFDDMTGCRTEKEISEKIRRVPPADAYGIGAFCTTHVYTKQLIEQIRWRDPTAYIVVGGPNPSAMPEFTLVDTGADAAVVGEGEDAIVECLDNLLVGRRTTGIVQGVPRDDIDSYSFPARDLVDVSSYSRTLLGQPVVSVISSRGCPHRCAYCNSPIMGGGSRRVRYRSAENLAREIELVRECYRNFRFNDDCFTEHPNLRELVDRLASLDISFRIFARVSHLTRENCLVLKRAGCVHVSVGLETLNPDNLRILGKGSQSGKEYHVRFAKEAGITVRSYFMVGLPFDTDETIDKYFGEAAKLGLDEFSVYPLIPYPGTKIASHPESFGYTIVNRDFRDYVQIGMEGKSCFALRHENFGPEDMQRWRERAAAILGRGGVRESKTSHVAG